MVRNRFKLIRMLPPPTATPTTTSRELMLMSITSSYRKLFIAFLSLPIHSSSVNICSLCRINKDFPSNFISNILSSCYSVILGLSNGAIRSIRLVVEPIGVRRGQSATLRCLYDLDGAPLLSVQFYRGIGQFYRFSPTQSPAKRVWPLIGINVDVSSPVFIPRKNL